MSPLLDVNKVVLRTQWSREREETAKLLDREWLVANGLGGYASGTVAGVATRRYHSYLTAALPAPLGRLVMLNHITEWIRLADQRTYRFGGTEWVNRELEMYGYEYLREFILEAGLPVWRYQAGGVSFEKRVLLPYKQNTVLIRYQLLSGDEPVRIMIRLAVNLRGHDEPVSKLPRSPYNLLVADNRFEIQPLVPLPSLRLFLSGRRSAFTFDIRRFEDILYRVEEQRGYESRGDLWSPGYFRADLTPDQPVTLIASAESWETMLALQPVEAFAEEYERRERLATLAHPETHANEFGRHLVLAADQFIITPVGRIEDTVRARAAGDDMRTIIAGYHWFTDWGRDTMISLEGLTLCTGRYLEAGYILRTFAHYVRDGLIPNLFPEGKKEGVYYTADATLWFFHALERYLQATDDRLTLRIILPKLLEIVNAHLAGTRFGIHVDPQDGLLAAGEEGYALTWMDAKVNGWVVTPRRGKPVELNALWYNALRLLIRWMHEEKYDEERAAELAGYADRAQESFNRRFWNEAQRNLFDVIDGENGNDSACRPNQLLSMTLSFPILNREYWPTVLETVQHRLLSPVGLRTLSPEHPDFKATYHGDLHMRDAAYHQGTIWPWLIGQFIDAWLQVHPERRADARLFLERIMKTHLIEEGCIGSISEIFDAREPYIPRGCIAQAWSVAEVLRCLVKTETDTEGVKSEKQGEKNVHR